MSDNEYESDSDSYEYESDSNKSESDFDSDSDSNESDTKCLIDKISISAEEYEFNKIPNDNFILNINTMQYTWTILCLKLKKYFDNKCIYNLNDNLNISFKFDDKKYTLSVSNESNKDLWYPYQAPTITYTGSKKIKLSQFILIINNEFLIKSKWNICNNLLIFISECNKILNAEIEYDFTNIDHILYDIIINSNLSFQFKLIEKLPTFGEIKLNTKKYTTYGNEKTYVDNKMIILNNLFKQLTIQIHNIDYELHNIITIICNNFINTDEISQLDVIINEDLYQYIIQIINILKLDINTEYIESKLNIISKPESEKISFIETFEYHCFSKNISNFDTKFIKRMNAEINNIKDILKDYPIYIIGTEQNIQLYKILIIPDESTPYAYGFYEFDLYIPSDYPHTVPQMKFLTTDGGKIRFNPNLYNNGKVCLSLLNTWSTNQWDSNNSNIYQILISIYTMIFVDHPMTNEPMHYEFLQHAEGRKKSEDYNKKIRQYNIDAAIKGQLNNDKSVFKEIINKYWTDNKDKILSKIKEWNLNF